MRSVKQLTVFYQGEHNEIIIRVCRKLPGIERPLVQLEYFYNSFAAMEAWYNFKKLDHLISLFFIEKLEVKAQYYGQCQKI